MTHTGFLDHLRIASGPLAEVALAIRHRPGALVFEDETGRQTDLDMRGTEDEICARHTVPARGPGRPKLGVTAREVTLLPRHWDWLAAQLGGASVALRKLVETASHEPSAARNAASASSLTPSPVRPLVITTAHPKHSDRAAAFTLNPLRRASSQSVTAITHGIFLRNA